MKGFIQDLWWMVLLRGIALLLFGLVAVVWPGLTFVTLAIFFAVYILVSGIMNILFAIGAIEHRQAWFVTLLLGVIEIGVGVYLLKSPGLALATFITAIGIIFMVQGILYIIASFVDTRDSAMRVLEIGSGILGIIAGFVILQNPASGGIAFAWVLGVYGLIAGTVTIAVALNLRQFVEEVEKDFERVISPRKSGARR